MIDAPPTKILVIAPRPDSAPATEAVWRSLGVDIVHARSETEAQSLLARLDFAAALLDVRDPETNGFETARMIQEHRSTNHLPIILLTANDEDEQRVRRECHAGPVYCLIEPVNPEVLRAKAEGLLRLHLQRKEYERINASLQQRIAELAKSSEAAHRFEQVIDSAGEAIILTDLNGTIEYVNGAFSKLTGYSKEEAIGKNPRFLKSGRHPEEFYQVMWSALLSGQVYRNEIINRHKDGTTYDASITVAGVLDDQGKPQHYVSVQRDITLEKKKRRALKAATKELGQKNKQLAEIYKSAHQYVDHVAHEFRTPLTVIGEYATIIRDGLAGPVTDQQRKFLKVVSDRTDDLAKMVDDMLDVSRLEAGRLSLWRKETALSDVVDRIRPMIDQKASVKTVSLEVSLEENLPIVYCDPEKIGRVIINLAVNAIKFCGEQGHIKIGARHDVEKSEVVVGITDDGPGISEENLRLIFERFQQVDGTAKSSTKGFGLGLSIAKELVSLNFGQIHVESEPGSGSTFSFTVPVWDPLKLAARYIRSVKSRDESNVEITLIAATIDPSVELAASNVIDEFLQSSFRVGDTIVRVSQHKWLLLVSCPHSHADAVANRVLRAWDKTNQDRPGSRRMPCIVLRSIGTWRVDIQEDGLLRRFCIEMRSRTDESQVRRNSPHDDRRQTSTRETMTDNITTATLGNVLVVDDDPALVDSLRIRLKGAGYNVFTAADGKAAVDSAVEHHPHAVLMDNYMPEMNGIDALVRLRKHPKTKNIPVIILSASPRDREKALRYGACFFFQKPCPTEMILSALGEVIGPPLVAGVEQR